MDPDGPVIGMNDLADSKSPLRILHLDCTTGYGGQERDHIAEALGMTGRGHRYVLGARPGTPYYEEAAQKTETLALPMKSNFDIDSFGKIRSFLMQEDIDVLVTTSYIDAFLGYLAASSLGEKRPLVIRQRHLLNVPKNMIPFRSFCDRMVVVSEALRIFFMERGIPFWHIVTIPRGIRVKSQEERVIVEKMAEQIPLSKELEGKKILLQIGVFQRDKGHHLMLDALKILFRQFPDLHMVFLGKGVLLEEVQSRATYLFGEEAGRRIHFMGVQPPAPYLALADLVVLPSVRDSFPLVTLEAIAARKEVVAFRVGGIPEIANILPGVHLVSPKNAMALARSIAETLVEPRGVFDRIPALKERMEKAFSIETSNSRTELFYRSALKLLRDGCIAQNPYREMGGKADPFCGSPV